MPCHSVPKTPLEQCAAGLQETKVLGVTFPMYVVPMETVLKMKKVKAHQELLKDGQLRKFDPAKGKAMFVSHQWTTEKHPDPDGKQFKVFQKAMSNLLSGQTVAQPDVFAEMVSSVKGRSATSLPTSKLTECPIGIWYDYFCVPQYTVTSMMSRSLSDNMLEDQRSAIASIPAYIDRCEFFVALCPLMKHSTNQPTLSTQSWQQRGWCRAEAVVGGLSVKNDITLIVESPRQVSLGTTLSMLKAPGDGDFTVPGDRKLVGELVKEVLHQKLHSALRNQDFCHYRFLLNHQAALLRNSGSTPIPGLLQDHDLVKASEPEEMAEEFLLQNGFEKVSDRDKSGWSPLLYAALGGSPKVVEALLLKGADPNDYLRKAPNLVMIEKGTPAISICALQQHNEAMRMLLQFWADPSKKDPTGSGPLFYACDSDNVEGARILLAAGADLSQRSIFDSNVFDQACLMGASRILKEVLKAPPDEVSRREALGLAMTTGHGNPETIGVLLQMGCDKDGVALQRNALAKVFVSALRLKHRVAPSALTTLFHHALGATPLMRGILTGSYACAHVLIESKARVDLRNTRTAFDLAVKKHAPDSLLWQLWKHGAGDHASKESISWWSSNAPERFPVAIEDLSDLVSPASSKASSGLGTTFASSILSRSDSGVDRSDSGVVSESESDDDMISVYF